jgi:hypothetical protein
LRTLPRGASRHALLAACLAACAKGATTQPSPVAGSKAEPESLLILTVQEVDEDRGKHTIAGRNGIVDINSAITVLVNGDALRSRVAGIFGADKIDPALLKRLELLQSMANSRLEGVTRLDEALRRYAEAPTPESFAAVRKASTGLASGVVALIEMVKPDSALSAKLEQRLAALFDDPEYRSSPAQVPLQYDAVLGMADGLAVQARRELDEQLQETDVRVQIGTWLSGRDGLRPVHAPSFDENAEQAAFVVDRWVIALDRDQREELDRLSVSAKAYNAGGFSGLRDQLSKTAGESISLVAKQAEQCAAEVRTVTTRLTTAGEASSEGALSEIRSHLGAIDELAQRLSAIAAKYRQPATTSDLSVFLAGTNADLVTMKAQLTGAAGRWPRIASAFKNISAAVLQGGGVPEGGAALVARVQECGRTALDLVSGLSAALGGIDHAEQIRTITEESWEKVLLLDVGSVPASSTIQLISAGPRRPGDLLLLRVAVLKQGDPRQTLDEQQLMLQRVLPHLEVSVGLIFADPLGSSEVRRKFQAAPSYSILYRRGSRESRNPFWSVGFGLNVAATDFDKDDVPEVGFGLTASTFRDLLQAGAGYNVFVGRAYWFFGVRLPVGVIGLSGRTAPVEETDE